MHTPQEKIINAGTAIKTLHNALEKCLINLYKMFE